MTPTLDIPEDAALPSLAVIRERGLARTLPALGLRAPVELVVRGYASGDRLTFEAQCGEQRLAVKAYADDPTREARLYRDMALLGLATGPLNWKTTGVRVPKLLAWDRKLRLLVTDWLEGPAANDLIKEGQGERAGELASRWFRRGAPDSTMPGKDYGPASILDQARKWVGTLAGADPELGSEAAALLRELASTQPPEESHSLVHGTLYARHIIDTGDEPGLIDWDGFGCGSPEYDAGTFLATVWRTRVSCPDARDAAVRAELAFLAGASGRLDESAMAWHRAAALLRLARRLTVRSCHNWKGRALQLLSEANRLAVTAAA